jgi:hypothetical protein
MKHRPTTGALLLILAVSVMAVAGCGNGNRKASEGQEDEHHTQQQIEDNYAKDQPVPALTNSQVRQNLIEIEEAVAEGVQTTSFEFNLGVIDPVKSCPSIGIPIPASAQVTNPEQVIDSGDHNRTAIPQMDPTGIYVNETSGTYVLCVDAEGKPYVSYWEGYVLSEFAPAKWNYDEHRVELIGSSSWEFSKSTPPSGTEQGN